jgi:hypothetical protein
VAKKQAFDNSRLLLPMLAACFSAMAVATERTDIGALAKKVGFLHQRPLNQLKH